MDAGLGICCGLLMGCDLYCDCEQTTNVPIGNAKAHTETDDTIYAITWDDKTGNQNTKVGCCSANDAAQRPVNSHTGA